MSAHLEMLARAGGVESQGAKSRQERGSAANTSRDLGSSRGPDLSTPLGQRYSVGRLLSHSVYGDRYVADDQWLNRTVDVKLCKPEAFVDRTSRTAFLAEAGVYADLDHPSVPVIHDIAQDSPRKLLWMVLSHRPGLSVAEVMVARRSTSDAIAAQPFTLDQAIVLFDAILEGVAYLHAQDYVHRNISLVNLQLSDDGRVILNDLSLAVLPPGRTEIPTRGLFFASPEHVLQSAINARSDVYSLAAVFYALVTGRPPFLRRSQESLAEAHRDETPTPPSELNSALPHWVDVVVAKGLAKDPSDRYADAGEFRADVRRYEEAFCGAVHTSEDSTHLCRALVTVTRQLNESSNGEVTSHALQRDATRPKPSGEQSERAASAGHFHPLPRRRELRAQRERQSHSQFETATDQHHDACAASGADLPNDTDTVSLPVSVHAKASSQPSAVGDTRATLRRVREPQRAGQRSPLDDVASSSPLGGLSSWSRAVESPLDGRTPARSTHRGSDIGDRHFPDLDHPVTSLQSGDRQLVFAGIEHLCTLSAERTNVVPPSLPSWWKYISIANGFSSRVSEPATTDHGRSDAGPSAPKVRRVGEGATAGMPAVPVQNPQGARLHAEGAQTDDPWPDQNVWSHGTLDLTAYDDVEHSAASQLRQQPASASADVTPQQPHSAGTSSRSATSTPITRPPARVPGTGKGLLGAVRRTLLG